MMKLVDIKKEKEVRLDERRELKGMIRLTEEKEYWKKRRMRDRELVGL
jgi:hypothetical protein